MKDILRRNLGYKLASLFMALLLWLFVMNEGTIQKSTGDQTLTLSLVAANLPSDMIIMSKLPSVQVRLQWSNVSFDTKELFAYVDLSSAVEGTQDYEVQIDVPSGVKVLEIRPSSVEIQIDKVIEKVLPVQPIIKGKPSEGYNADKAVIKPSSVNVRGASSVLSTLENVYVEVSIEGASETVQVNTPILFRDNNGNSILSPNLGVNILTANPSSVDVIVPIYSKGLSSKHVPIKVTSTGQPSDGKILKALIPTPASLTLIGDSNALSKIDSITVGPIDISGLNQDQVITVGVDKINLPQGVSISSVSSINVLVQFTDRPIERTLRVPVQMRNLSPDLELEESIAPVDITIYGAPEIVNAVTADQIELWVDGTNLSEGEHNSVTVYWESPPGVEIKNVPKVSFRLKTK